MLRNQAMEQGFVVADADLSPERRLAGSKNQSVATYRELMGNIATRTNPNGGTIALILEKWISTLLAQVAQELGYVPRGMHPDACDACRKLWLYRSFTQIDTFLLESLCKSFRYLIKLLFDYNFSQ